MTGVEGGSGPAGREPGADQRKGRTRILSQFRWGVGRVAPLACAVVLSACTENTPTLGGEGRFPVRPVTVEWVIPFDRFASDLQVVGGFGRASEVGSAVVSLSDSLESRAILRLAAYPRSASLPDSLGVIRTDTLITFLRGNLVLFLDSLRYTPAERPIPLRILSLQGGDFDPATATWELAVDTLGGRRPWPQPGAGPAAVVAEEEWIPMESDSVVFPVDSATVAAWGDTLNPSRGIRVDAALSGSRVRVRSAALRLVTRPSVNRDTLVTLSVGAGQLSFVYAPLPAPPAGELRVGGAPAWRTAFRISLPPRIQAPDPLCATLSCPVELTPEAVVFAALDLRSRAAPAGFRPADTLSVDVRPVLDPDRFPRSPLGSSFLPFGQLVAPEWFGSSPGRTVSVPVTNFVRDLVRGETPAGRPPPAALALLSPLEPLAFEFTPFEGPGTDGAPTLRILLTLMDGVRLP